MVDVQIKGVYTAVEVRERPCKRPGVVYALTFECDHGETIKVFVMVDPAALHPLRMLAALLASAGVPEPRFGWNAALCVTTQVNEWKEPVTGNFLTDTGLRAISHGVLGKRAGVLLQVTEQGRSYIPGPPFGLDNVVSFPSRA